MELPSFHHRQQQPRYAPSPHGPPLPPPHPHGPPLPPPPIYFNESQLYPQHRPLRPTSPFSRTSPPPLSSSCNSHQSRFIFANHGNHGLVEGNTHRPKFDNIHRKYSLSRVSNRTMVDDNRLSYIPEVQSTVSDYRSDTWFDPPRVVAPESRRHVRFERERDSHRCGLIDQTQVSPYRPSDKRRLDIEDNFRRRDELQSFHSERVLLGRIDSFGGDSENDFQRIHNDYVSDLSQASRISLYRDSHIGSNSNFSAPKDFGTNLVNYRQFDSYSLDIDRFQHYKNDNGNWNDVRSNIREFPDIHDEAGNQFETYDDDNIAPFRCGYNRYPSGKSNYRGSREGSRDFLRISQKKIQKKSVLQRLQSSKPNNKKQSNGHRLSFAQSVEVEPKNLRLRSIISYPEKRTEDDRSVSKVEPDASFKSNGLLARLGNRKLEELETPSVSKVEPDASFKSNGLIARLGNRKLEELETPSNGLSNSSDRIVKFGSKILDGKGVVSGCGFAKDNFKSHDIDSDASPHWADSKVTWPLSHVLGSKVTKKHYVPIKLDSSRNSVSEASLCDVTLGEQNNISASGSMQGTVMQSSSDQITSLLDNKLMQAPCALLADPDSTKVSIPNIVACANTNTFDPFVVSSSGLENESDMHRLNVRISGSIDFFDSTNSIKDPIIPELIDTDPDNVLKDDIERQSYDDKSSESPKSVGSKNDSHLSHPLDIGVHENHYDTESFDHNTNVVINLLSNDSSPADPTSNQASVLLENISVDEDQMPSISLVEDGDNLDSSYHIEINGTVADTVGSNNTVSSLLASDIGKTKSPVDLVTNLAQTEVSLEETIFLLQNNLIAGPAITDDLNVNLVKKQHKRKIDDMDSMKSTMDDVTLNLGCGLKQEEDKSSSYIGLAGTSPRCKKNRYINADVLCSPTLSQIQGSPNCTGFYIPDDKLTLVSDKFYTGRGDEFTESNTNTLASSGLSSCSDSLVLVDNEMGIYSLDLARDVLNDSKLEPQLVQAIALEDHNNFKNPLNFATVSNLQNTATMHQVQITLEVETTLKSNHFDSPGQEDHGQQFADMLLDNILPKKDGLPYVSYSASQYSDRVDPSANNSHEIENCFMNVLPNGTSPDTLSTDEESHILDTNCAIETRDFEKPVSESRTPLVSCDKSPSTSTFSPKSVHKMACLHTVTSKTMPSLLHCNPTGMTLRNSRPITSVPRVFPIYSNTRMAAPLDNKVKPRTWHRIEKPSSLPVHGKKSLNIVPLQNQLSASIETVQNAYVRKGNSLLRKPSTIAGSVNSVSSSVYRPNSFVQYGMKNKAGVDNIVNAANSLKCLRSDIVDRAKTPPLPNTSKIFDCRSIFSQDSASLLVTNPHMETSSQSMPGDMEDRENIGALNPSEGGPSPSHTPEDQTCVIQSHIVENNQSSKIGTGRKLVYVKSKSNQLVASSASDPSVQYSEQADGYVKLKRNQLIKKPLNCNALQDVVTLNTSSDRTRPIASTSAKRPSIKGLRKTYRHSRGSLVWTLNNRNSSKESSLVYQVPNLFPWKRSSQWGNVIRNSAWVSEKSKNRISKNLLARTKRDAIYTRSKHGFSLRISKILSVGGSSLKWSKSIERNSRKAKEEATLAVAAAEKKKREQNGASGIGTGSRRKSHSPSKLCKNVRAAPRYAIQDPGVADELSDCLLLDLSCRRMDIWGMSVFFFHLISYEIFVWFPDDNKRLICLCITLVIWFYEYTTGKRIFRIGSFRYKMDPSRRTLRRISGDLTSSGENQAEKDPKICLVPKRLQIGNNEYVRIGNGNQLIRDPKTRVRILASEKVRWSLHTARLRLAKKNTYCQFLTKFGTCNKDGGKCPYIHDPSKIAVCTKFIKGSCSDPVCKLTHKVIPERMEDCSYFLQGLCFNKDCPYRHVNVNPNAPICEGFLRGYCVQGDECRKKHSYVCAVFEATGSCPLGSKCKLRHPKRRLKGGGKKRKISEESNNANKVRYFEKSCIDVSADDGEKTTQPSKGENKGDIFFQDGRYTDFISLDDSDYEEADHMIESSSELLSSKDGDSIDYLEAQIKPDFVLKKRRLT